MHDTWDLRASLGGIIRVRNDAGDIIHKLVDHPNTTVGDLKNHLVLCAQEAVANGKTLAAADAVIERCGAASDGTPLVDALRRKA